MTDADCDTETNRIRFGDEHDERMRDGTLWYLAPEGDRCPDCGVGSGEYHTTGCDEEQCPVCGLQLISCEHGDEVLT